MRDNAAIIKALDGERFSTLPATLNGVLRGMRVILAMDYSDEDTFEKIAQMVGEQRMEGKQ